MKIGSHPVKDSFPERNLLFGSINLGLSGHIYHMDGVGRLDVGAVVFIAENNSIFGLHIHPEKVRIKHPHLPIADVGNLSFVILNHAEGQYRFTISNFDERFGGIGYKIL